MNNLSLIIGMSLSLTVIASCGSKSDSGGSAPISKDGTCTQAMIDSHDQVKHAIDSYNEDHSKSRSSRLKDRCISFKSLLADNTCTTVDKTTGAAITESYSGTIKNACEFVISAKDSKTPVAIPEICSSKVVADVGQLQKSLVDWREHQDSRHSQAVVDKCRNLENSTAGSTCVMTDRDTRSVNISYEKNFSKFCEAFKNEN